MFVINKTANLDLYRCQKARQDAINTAINLSKNPYTTPQDRGLVKRFLMMEAGMRQNHDFAAIMKAAKRTVDRERRILR